jgi:translation initiation factor 2-alpha kinase 4
VDHKHIVRYFSCWLEQVGPPEVATPAEDTPDAVTPSHASSDSDIFAVNFDELSMSHHSRSASFPRIRFADSRANSDDEDDDDDDDDDDDNDDSRDDSQDTDSDSTASDDSDSSADTVADPSERKSRSTPINIISKPSTDFTGTTIDDGSVQEILYIQMEFVEKQTLREAIQNGLSDEQCWRLFVQILQALAHMSTMGIVHRGKSLLDPGF